MYSNRAVEQIGIRMLMLPVDKLRSMLMTIKRNDSKLGMQANSTPLFAVTVKCWYVAWILREPHTIEQEMEQVRMENLQSLPSINHLAEYDAVHPFSTENTRKVVLDDQIVQTSVCLISMALQAQGMTAAQAFETVDYDNDSRISLSDLQVCWGLLFMMGLF